jgi:hypothetical protein
LPFIVFFFSFPLFFTFFFLSPFLLLFRFDITTWGFSLHLLPHICCLLFHDPNYCFVVSLYYCFALLLQLRCYFTLLPIAMLPHRILASCSHLLLHCYFTFHIVATCSSLITFLHLLFHTCFVRFV